MGLSRTTLAGSGVIKSIDSKPLHAGEQMDQLHVWLTAQFAEKKVEPNSGMPPT